MKGFSCAALLTLFFVTALARGSHRPGPQVAHLKPLTPPPEYGFSCQAPVEGLWRFQSNFQMNGSESAYETVATSELNLVRQGDTNVYNATGLLTTTNGLFVDIPVTLVALYNPATCYMTGTGFAQITNVSDSFTWWSTGTTLYGPYVVAQNATLLSPLLGISNATFLG